MLVIYEAIVYFPDFDNLGGLRAFYTLKLGEMVKVNFVKSRTMFLLTYVTEFRKRFFIFAFASKRFRITCFIFFCQTFLEYRGIRSKKNNLQTVEQLIQISYLLP